MWQVTEDRIMAKLNGVPHFSEFDDQFDHGIVVLSYEGIEIVYHDLATEFSKFAIALDLTENEITDLSFLKTFHKLQSLVLDKNRHMNPKTMPTMKNLQILWLNGCNIPDITKWIEVIRVKCPKLQRLSLINNPGARSLINLSTTDENEEYRCYVAGRLKKLEYLDEAPVIRNGRMAGRQFITRMFHFNNDYQKASLDKSDSTTTTGSMDISKSYIQREEHERDRESYGDESKYWWSFMD